MRIVTAPNDTYSHTQKKYVTISRSCVKKFNKTYNHLRKITSRWSKIFLHTENHAN